MCSWPDCVPEPSTIGLGLLGGWAPLVFLVGFTGLELVVAFLQAFIFTVLTCIYLNDAVNMHH